MTVSKLQSGAASRIFHLGSTFLATRVMTVIVRSIESRKQFSRLIFTRMGKIKGPFLRKVYIAGNQIAT